MEKVEIIEKVKLALDKLLINDAFLLSKNLNINERSVTHRFAIYLEELFLEYNVDCEYNRMYDDSIDEYIIKNVDLPKIKNNKPMEDIEARTVFPDIIIHDRKTSKRNLLAIEVKMGWKKSKWNFDIYKIKAYKANLKYQHCFYIEIGPGPKYIINEIE